MDKSQLGGGQRLLFIGNNITDCGRPQTEHWQLGADYVKFFAHLQQLREPAKKVDVINRGIGGHTAEDLHASFLDTHQLFESFLAHRRVSDISNDCVHLNELGALILAEGLQRYLRVAG